MTFGVVALLAWVVRIHALMPRARTGCRTASLFTRSPTRAIHDRARAYQTRQRFISIAYTAT